MTRPVCENFVQVATASRNKQVDVQKGFKDINITASPRLAFSNCAGNVENTS